jgi:hypothetical protein
MKGMLPLVKGQLLLIFLLLGACAGRFALLNLTDGWVKLSGAPSEEKTILAAADQNVSQQYESSDYAAYWFTRSDGEYLIYFYNHTLSKESESGSDHCGEATVIFKQDGGHWMQEPENEVSCLD